MFGMITITQVGGSTYHISPRHVVGVVELHGNYRGNGTVAEVAIDWRYGDAAHGEDGGYQNLEIQLDAHEYEKFKRQWEALAPHADVFKIPA